MYKCITNPKDSDTKTIGQRYKGTNAKIAAVIKIQSTYKMVLARRRHKWFIDCKPIARRLIQHYKQRKYKKYLQELRKVH